MKELNKINLTKLFNEKVIKTHKNKYLHLQVRQSINTRWMFEEAKKQSDSGMKVRISL